VLAQCSALQKTAAQAPAYAAIAVLAVNTNSRSDISSSPLMTCYLLLVAQLTGTRYWPLG